MSDCLFCKLVNGDIPSEKLYEDEDVIAFKDISPQAPIHFLVIPKKHISTLNDLCEEDIPLIGKMHFVAQQVAAQLGVAENGFRTVVNCNQDGGQTVYHIHMHVLAGRSLTWPPG